MSELDDSKFTFKGAGYIKIFDHTRLTGQALGIYDLMKDGKWRTLSEINTLLGHPEASISAQLRTFRRKEFGSHTVDRRRRGERENGLHEYRLVVPQDDPRAPKQREVVDLYFEKNQLLCTFVLGTGFGKSKVTLDIVNTIKPPNILILVNSTDLKDYSWRDEFYKFGMGMIYERDVHIITYQEAYKWTKETKQIDNWLIIADEVDFAADVPEYSKFFYEFSHVRTIGFTGFITEEKRPWFAKHLPILYVYTIGEAQKDKVLNKMHFVLVKYELFKHKTIEVSYTKAGKRESFMTSENASYEYNEKKFLSFIIQQKELEKKMRNGDITSVEYEQENRSLDYSIKRVVKERNNVILHSHTSIQMVKKLQEKFIPDTAKTIIFSVFTDQAEKISDFTYHTGNSVVYNRENFAKFNSGEIKTLGVCSKINRGVNVNRLDTAIFETYYGSDTQANQRLGRLARLNPDETSTVYVLLPYYRYGTKDEEGKVTYALRPTQQITWCKNMLRSTKMYSHEIIDWTHNESE
jgi:superfamily II DNA or RNA helicase